ncbi:hypothetical protein GCM10010423_69410 [Streptomyces levis]|uniref:Uncharacterized protein n=1 Tax=Streptomyces levis TaxID=285566 RepID=A0ABN3P3F8_9ACTN
MFRHPRNARCTGSRPPGRRGRSAAEQWEDEGGYVLPADAGVLGGEIGDRDAGWDADDENERVRAVK